MNQFVEAMSLELPPASHPNRAPFRGVLTLLDVPSDRPPAGARGHRVVLTRAAAEAALSSLLGMGLGYRPSLDGHDARRKVGVITSAEIQPLSHYLSEGPDFSRAVRRAAVWVLTEVTFTGAAILRRSKAAYENTSIELTHLAPPSRSLRAASRRACPERSRGALGHSPADHEDAPLLPGESTDMNQQNLLQLIATTERLAAAAEALSAAAGRLEQHQDELGERQQSLNAQVERIVAAVEEGEAVSRRVLEQRIAELERSNAELQTQAGRLAASAARKTLPPLVSSLLAKHGIEADSAVDPATLDKTLASLSLEQRIAVKSQMARAGIIE